MKKVMLFLLLFSSALANAQSLKETLYGGKLKNTPGTVIRKGDDLSSKIDTTTKATSDTVLKRAPGILQDSSAKKLTIQADSAASIIEKQNNNVVLKDTAALETVNPVNENISVSKRNDMLWKAYIDSVATTLKTEVLSSKKIKRGNYYVSVSYSIGTNGQVAINNVLLTPENNFLQQQIKDRLLLDAPRLNPVLSGSGTPRKVTKNYNFTLIKE